MTGPSLDRTVREFGTRIVAALAARFRDLDLAEEAFAEACARAAERWPRDGNPREPAAWLYRVAMRASIDALRRRRTRLLHAPEEPEPEPTAEELMSEAPSIPDERLRLIFVCCHPAVAVESRAALTLRIVCRLSVQEIARAFLISEPTLLQRLTRAKHKIAEAGVPFEVPSPDAWNERLDAVYSTIEVAYAKAHEDAAGSGPHAQYAAEMLALSALLAELVPHEPDALSLAAMLHYAEARRPARVDRSGIMVPLSEQDPLLWHRPLIDKGHAYQLRAIAQAGRGRPTPRVIQAQIHRTWCARRSLDEPAPWRDVLALYDMLLEHRDDAIVRLNRIVALAEVAGAQAALGQVEQLDAATLANFLPYHAVRADLLRRLDRPEEACAAYDAALALGPETAERNWLLRRRDRMAKDIRPIC